MLNIKYVRKTNKLIGLARNLAYHDNPNQESVVPTFLSLNGIQKKAINVTVKRLKEVRHCEEDLMFLQSKI